MADAKYGRLYTEEDVRGMLIEAACWGMGGPQVMTAAEIAEQTLVDYPATLPADEPLFLLRGQDAAAPDAIDQDRVNDQAHNYRRAAKMRGAGLEHLLSVERAADQMRAWQREHPDRVKRPD